MKCKCGCGQEFEPSDGALWRMKHGINAGYIAGHSHKGSNNNRWKGGRFVSADGYIYLLKPEHPNALKNGYKGYIAEHRYVMSEHLGRPLETCELVHHINGNKSDNRIENLVLITRNDHASEHQKGDTNMNWCGGRQPITCKTCGKEFFPSDRRNDYGALYCSKQCFYDRNKH